MIIEPFDPRNAADGAYAALYAFTSRLRLELLPDDPLTPLDEAIAAWRAAPALANVVTWIARGDHGDVLARAQASWPHGEENRLLAQASIQVLPEERRHGLARALLAPVVEVLRARGRHVVIAETSGRVSAGAAFVERLGGERGLETHTHQLRISELDRGLVQAWQERAGERAGAYELRLWEGPHPEADLEAIARLYDVMNTQPLGTLAVEHQSTTPAQLRQFEAALAVREGHRWTLAARERTSGRFAGFTEAFWKPSAPQVLQQGNTGVFTEDRGRGLGRWLKAAMLERVLAGRPEIQFVRTGNADSNAAMLAINRELGFRPYASRILWQVPLDRIGAYLAG